MPKDINRQDALQVLHILIAQGFALSTKNGRLHYSQVGDGVLQEQLDYMKEHKDELIYILTTPPPIKAQCYRGHEITWKQDMYGRWVCACYFLPVLPNVTAGIPVEDRKRILRTYWQDMHRNEAAIEKGR